MITATISDFRKNIKKYFSSVTKNFETLIIHSGKNFGVVVISLEEYNSLLTTQLTLYNNVGCHLTENTEKGGKLKELIELGFKKVGKWELDNEDLICNLNNNLPSKNILYSFVYKDEIKYIGKSVKSISERLYGYRKPNKSQTTNYRINKLIIEKLKNGIQVEIYLFVDNIGLNYRGHKINLSAGLEDNLIAEFLPEWNSTEKNY